MKFNTKIFYLGKVSIWLYLFVQFLVTSCMCVRLYVCMRENEPVLDRSIACANGNYVWHINCNFISFLYVITYWMEDRSALVNIYMN